MEETVLDFASTTGATVTTEELDHVISTMYKAKQDYDQKKIVSTEAHHHLEDCKAQVTELLRNAGKTEYVVEGVGKATLVDKLKVITPKSPEEKALLFKWIKETMGADGFLAHVGVNYQTLQRLYNESISASPNPAEFNMPGVGQPQSFIELRFRKS